jgi:hypothetical protein
MATAAEARPPACGDKPQMSAHNRKNLICFPQLRFVVLGQLLCKC